MLAAARRPTTTSERRAAAVSKAARGMVVELLGAPPPARRQVMAELSPRDLRVLLAATEAEFGTPYGLYIDDPVGFVEDVLGETVWSKQREILEALASHKRVAVPAGFGVGKCIAMDERIPLADGRVVAAKDLVGTEFEVMAWQQDGTQVRRRARAAWNAIEPVYRVRVLGGREIVRNGAHPLWAGRPSGRMERRDGRLRRVFDVDGWTPIKNLTLRDYVLVPERHEAEGTEAAPLDHCKLVGYLLGDGCLSEMSTVQFAQLRGRISDDFQACAERIGAVVRRVHDVLLSTAGPAPRRPGGNPVLNLVREWGMEGISARHKHVPDRVFTLPNEQVAVVLNRLFATDGCAVVHTRPSGAQVAQISFTTSSQRLAKDVEVLMLRLGISGNMVIRSRRGFDKATGPFRNYWQWSIQAAADIVRFADTVGIFGKEPAVAAARAVAARSTRATKNTASAPPGYRWVQVRQIEELPETPTVAIEVEQDHTFVTTFVEHNTHLAARGVLWFVCTRPVGSALAVTTATRMRQVQRQLWPHIRRAHARAHLPGDVDQIQLSMNDRNGVRTTVSYGFTVPENDEAALQGIHSGAIFLVVDEAGGIPRNVGGGTNNLLTGDARMLAIGNPATDEEDSWFESLCAAGDDPSITDTITIAIPVTSSPAITGEDAGLCTDHPESPPHPLAGHLPDQRWIDDTIRDFGEDSPYVQAKVHARFPRGALVRIIPTSWLEAAHSAPEPAAGPGWRRLCELGLVEEVAEYLVQDGAWVRLGVDVAAAGGDELVIARCVGDLYTVEHASSGAENASAVDVAGKVLAQIRRAEALAVRLGSTDPVRVKVDTVGLGWGVTSQLTRWGSEGRHGAQIVAVNVAESTGRVKDDGAAMTPARKRDEMWIAGRSMVQPAPVTGQSPTRLRVDRHTLRQLSLPSYRTTSAGLTEVESKKTMKARGEKSPDRAEAVLLATYEPRLKRAARLIV